MQTDDVKKCKLYNKNQSNPFHIEATYGGIPQNLVTNLIILSILLASFLILRKSAWKLLNKIVRKNDVERWTHIFFSFTDHLRHPRHGHHGDPLENETDATPASSDQDPVDRVALQRQRSVGDSRTFGEWLKSIFTLPDEDIEERCGSDALQYIRFIRYIILYLTLVTTLAICVVLPLNFQGSLQGDVSSFEHTTLVNLAPDSEFLWVHVILSFVFFPLAIVVMRKFSVDVGFQDVSLEISRTLMIEKVPRYLCKREELERHFHEAFPGSEVKEMKFAFNVNRLQSIHNELMDARSGMEYCQRHQALGRPEFHVYAAPCSRCCFCICCCFCAKQDALEYYTKEESRLHDDFETEKAAALQEPLGIVFVTFKSVNMSKKIYDSHRRGFFTLNFQPPKSSLSKILKPHQWKVTFAPPPDDIYWENLSVSRRFLYLKKLVINIGLFVITFFLTTPEYLVSQTDYIIQFFGKGLKLPAALVEFIPTLMLWGFTAFMPLLVSWSDRFLGHWTRSGENHAIMKKTFWYLLFMVVFLPTFGFTTAQASINFLFTENKNDTYRWECVFLPDSGAFFVNYIITAALVGTGLELVRFPELLFYCLQICWSKSEADIPAIRRAMKYEFRFGEQYARMMLMFCMTMMYSLSCPLIVPFGWLYFVMKYFVDRHNLLYAYKPSKINKGVHSTAISFVILSTLVLLFFMMVFTVIRSGGLSELTLKSKAEIGLFLVAVNIFSAQLWSDTCKKFSPIEYLECTYLRESELHNREHIYLPDILKSSSEKYRQKESDLRAEEQEQAMKSIGSQDSRIQIIHDEDGNVHEIYEVPSDDNIAAGDQAI